MIILCFRGKINISGCGAVGSARGSGLRGRQFKSGHPDHEKKNDPSGIIFIFICIGVTRWERSSTGRRSERKIKACFYFFERGETEGFLQKILIWSPRPFQGGKIKKIYFLYLIDAEWKDFAIAKAYHEIIKKTGVIPVFFGLLIIINLFCSRCHTNLLVCGETLHHL